MDRNERKVLNNLYYYSMMAVVIVFTVLFFIKLNTTPGVATYQMIVYNVWAALVILASIFDVIATLRKRMKILSGLIIYSLAFLWLLVGFIVFASLSVNGVIAAGFMQLFSVLVFFTLAITIGLFTQFSLGVNVDRLSDDNM